MRICHFLMSLHPQYGGPTASVPIQCRGLSKEGVEVALVTYTESRPYESQLIADGVNIIDFERPKSRLNQMFQWSLRSFLKQDDDAQIYHYHGVWLPCNHWIAAAARRKGKKYVLNPRGDLEIYRINYSRWKRLKKNIVWQLYGMQDTQQASCIIATSQQEANAIRDLGITAPIAIIPNGIELSAFPQILKHATRSKRVLLFLSRVNPIKGLELLIDAWAQLPVEYKNGWELHIAGNSDPVDYVYKLEQQISNLRINDSVRILGPITGVEKLQKYMDSDLFVLPTYNENFGNVIAESMMCECPVITTTNAPWEILNREKCGWWIDLSVENLVKTLGEAMSMTDEQRIELGKKSRRCIINNFSSESVAKKTKQVYEWVLGKIEKPDFINII